MAGPAAPRHPAIAIAGSTSCSALASESTRLRSDCTSFFFVRHGETDGNHAKIFQTAEQPLNARGLAAGATAARSRSGRASRADHGQHHAPRLATAEIISAPHKLTPQPMDGLRERWFGDLVGTPSGDHDWRDLPPNGETLAYFVERTQRGLREALTPREPTALVAHGGTLYVLAASLGLELDNDDYANATPLLVARSGSGWKVTRLAASTGSGDNIS